MLSAVRAALTAVAVLTVAFASLGIGDAAAGAADSRGVQAYAEEHASDLSDRRRRSRRSYRRSWRGEPPSELKPPLTAESRCDARELVQVDWDFIERVVVPIGDQRQHLTELKAMVAQADAKIVASCTIEEKLTPTGRLDATEKRLEMRLEALKSMRAPLEAFYSALDDEQKARFVSATVQPGSARASSDTGTEASDTGLDRRSRRSRRR
jgi:hypothetical protein